MRNPLLTVVLIACMALIFRALAVDGMASGHPFSSGAVLTWAYLTMCFAIPHVFLLSRIHLNWSTFKLKSGPATFAATTFCLLYLWLGYFPFQHRREITELHFEGLFAIVVPWCILIGTLVLNSGAPDKPKENGNYLDKHRSSSK